MKRTANTGSITKLANGRFWARTTDAQGKRVALGTFGTAEEAQAVLVSRAVKQITKEPFKPVPIPTCGGVYFVREIGNARLVKIGFADNIKQRLGSFDTHTPNGVALIGFVPGADMRLEKAFHAQFAGLRARREWFRCTGYLFDFLRSLNGVCRCWSEDDRLRPARPHRHAARGAAGGDAHEAALGTS